MIFKKHNQKKFDNDEVKTYFILFSLTSVNFETFSKAINWVFYKTLTSTRSITATDWQHVIQQLRDVSVRKKQQSIQNWLHPNVSDSGTRSRKINEQITHCWSYLWSFNMMAVSKLRTCTQVPFTDDNPSPIRKHKIEFVTSWKVKYLILVVWCSFWKIGDKKLRLKGILL